MTKQRGNTDASGEAPDGSIVSVSFDTSKGKEVGDGDATLGISFGERGSKDGGSKTVIISDVQKNGLAHETEIHKGMELLALNGVGNIQSSEAANQILSEVATGTMISIVARHPLGFVPIYIPRAGNEPLGISLGGATEQKGKKIVVLTDLKEGSPAALNQKLQPGMIIRAVHHKKCSDLTPKEVYTLIYQQHAGSVKLLVEPSNAYARRAETEIFDTYHKPPPDDLPTDGGFWASKKYCACKDVVILPCIFVMASFGLIFTNRTTSKRSIYIVNGKGYDKNGKLLGDESLFVK